MFRYMSYSTTFACARHIVGPEILSKIDYSPVSFWHLRTEPIFVNLFSMKCVELWNHSVDTTLPGTVQWVLLCTGSRFLVLPGCDALEFSARAPEWIRRYILYTYSILHAVICPATPTNDCPKFPINYLLIIHYSFRVNLELQYKVSASICTVRRVSCMHNAIAFPMTHAVLWRPPQRL